MTKAPAKVFISYSWDDNDHKEWVRVFATRLRTDGIDVTLDRWHAKPGDQLPRFMETAVRESDYVLVICTPSYKEKSDQGSGGVGYEGGIMTGEGFVLQNERKFIPVLRREAWKESAPSWLLGKFYIDLRGDPYDEIHYLYLLTWLRGEGEDAPPIGGNSDELILDKDDIEFANRKEELQLLDPAKPQTSYNQWVLISSPTGSGKSRLLKHLKSNLENDPDLREKWCCCYADLRCCENLIEAPMYFARSVIGEHFVENCDKEELKNYLCNYIHDKLSNGSSRGVLLIIDSIDLLTKDTINWFYAVINEIVVGSYMDYEKGEISFSARIILAGIDTETFWNQYKVWEENLNLQHRLKTPRKLQLSAFEDAAVQELIVRRADKNKINVPQSLIPNISNELLFLSGGHPAVINAILDELISIKFRLFQDYLKNKRELLINKHVTTIVEKLLQSCLPPGIKEDIKTVCVFRLNDLNILRRLSMEKLISSETSAETLLKLLLEKRILQQPYQIVNPFYHGDIIHRIIYLDSAYGDIHDREHVQKVHIFAKNIYRELIDKQDSHLLGFYFVEWLFHALQIIQYSEQAIVGEWKQLILSRIQDTTFLPDHLEQTIRRKLEGDREVKFIYRERFHSEDLSPLFDF